MESTLFLFLCLYYLASCITLGVNRFTQPRLIFTTGLVLGVIFLARADSFLLFFCYLYSLARHRVDKGVRSLMKPCAYAGLGAAIPVVPYLIINYLSFGRLETVSSWRKFHVPTADTIFRPLQRFYEETVYRIAYIFSLPESSEGLILIVVAGVVAAALIFTWKMRKRLAALVKPADDFVLFVIVHFLFVYLFVPEEAIFSIWYHVPQIVAAGLVIGLSVDLVFGKMSPKFSMVCYIAGVAFLLWQFHFYGSFVSKKTMTAAKIEMAQNVAHIVPPYEPVAMYDAGIVSYFSQHRFIPLNGLVGDFEIARLCDERDFGKLFRRFGVKYLVVDVPESMLWKFPSRILYSTSVRSKIMNMREPPKPLVLFQIDSSQVNDFFFRLRETGR
jgi:hypothetical protein